MSGLQVDSLLPQEIDSSRQSARLLGDAGYDGFWVGESRHDPWMQSLVAAEVAPAKRIGTAIVVAFARTPMTVAVSGYDLNRYARGRFVLGLGTQVRPHIVRRYSMPWSEPVARMREYVIALREIWSAWENGTPLEFRGTFYTHDLMTPVSTPAAHEWGPPPVYLAGVGSEMLRLCGEVADGFVSHPFSSRSYLAGITLPGIAGGATAAGRGADEVALVCSVLVATGHTDGEIERAVGGVRRWLSFYSSTPAYAPVLEHHGFGDLHPEMRALSRAGRWDEMARRFPDELVGELAVVGSPGEAGEELAGRYGTLANRLSLNLSGNLEPGVHAELLTALRDAL